MNDQQLASLAGGSGWLTEAGTLLGHLGFTLVNGDRPSAAGGANLLVALRATPTLTHYDPEEVTYWTTDGGRGRIARIDRAVEPPAETLFSWGRIRLTDRLGVSNHFIAFGGTLRTGPIDPTTLIVGFSSPAPVLRSSGHSQGVDPMTEEVGAFFGRLMVPIDFVPGTEMVIAAATPVTLYAAFLQDLRERSGRSAALSEEQRGAGPWLQHESQRLETSAMDDWHAGTELRRTLGLIPS